MPYEFVTQGALRRPVRLSEATRRFAYESLHHKYGLDTARNDAVSMDDAENWDALSDLEKYDLCIRRIAETAPVRICEGELLSGAATLGAAIRAGVPAKRNGTVCFGGVNHLTIDYETALRRGLRGLREDVEASIRAHGDPESAAFLRSCLHSLESFEIWHGRYLDALRGRDGYEENYRALLRVPTEPATSFREALQCVWFVFAFTRLCGNWPGIGRIDAMLGEYLRRDLESGAVTLSEARELLAHFFIKGCEWICGGNYGSGDAQHYQNVVLAGVDEDGREVTNEVTWLVLDVLEELGISDFPTTVRLNRNTDERLIRRVAEIMRFGGGILAVYNEDLILEALAMAGYPLREARRFANDGCWEVQIPGKTFFLYCPFDGLAVLQRKTLREYDGTAEYPDFESLYRQYVSDLREKCREIASEIRRRFMSEDPFVWKRHTPCTVISLFENGCVETAKSYSEGGPVYNLMALHVGGYPDTVNALYAVQKLVYEEKRLTLAEFEDVLRRNWEGFEPLRREALHRYRYFGNDNEEVDSLAARLMRDFAEICRGLDGICGFRFPPGISTFGRQLEWSYTRLASPHGHRIGDVMAANCSPTPGSDAQGVTSVIRSYCRGDLRLMETGAALDVRLLPGSVAGETGLAALTGILRSFVELGGFFMQPDVVDASVLREAQEHPEDYQTLSVRVSGWNARFVTLDRNWQDMVIAQAEK